MRDVFSRKTHLKWVYKPGVPLRRRWPRLMCHWRWPQWVGREAMSKHFPGRAGSAVCCRLGTGCQGCRSPQRARKAAWSLPSVQGPVETLGTPWPGTGQPWSGTLRATQCHTLLRNSAQIKLWLCSRLTFKCTWLKIKQYKMVYIEIQVSHATPLISLSKGCPF